MTWRGPGLLFLLAVIVAMAVYRPVSDCLIPVWFALMGLAILAGMKRKEDEYDG